MKKIIIGLTIAMAAAVTVLLTHNRDNLHFEKYFTSENTTGKRSPQDHRLIMVRSGKKWGFIDRTGETIIEPQFDGAECFPKGWPLF